MEKLKSLLPDDLKLMIAESTSDNLNLTCGSLLEFYQPLPQFQNVIEDLTGGVALCRKSLDSALDWKKKGNICFIEGEYRKALSLYSKALRYAPMGMDDMDYKLIGTLYVNRASALHKIGLFEECIRDCSRAIAIYPVYAKAWYRRGKANASIQHHEAAIHDLEVSLCMEDSVSGKSQIKDELQLLLCNVSARQRNSSYCSQRNNNLHDELVEPCDIKLHCISTADKGRGIISSSDIQPSSLILLEEPIAAVITKSCRETHCHFCFNKLPADSLFCNSCTISLYCSEHCLEQAVGNKFVRSSHFCSMQNILSQELWKHANESISKDRSACANYFCQHTHECGGSHWPAVLPTDIILAARVLMKCMEKKKVDFGLSNHIKTLDFSHNYNQVPPSNKLEMHFYALVLAFCLRHHLPSLETCISKLVLLISQIKVNSMAVIHMKSVYEPDLFTKLSSFSRISNAFTNTIEQVRVGQAIYFTGSLFNHSCKPNVHAYFLSRTLHLRCTEFVPAKNPLELSYGPQVGQLDLQERQEILEDQYSFKCSCTACSELNLSDLVINSFQCPRGNCLGAIMGNLCYEKNEDGYLVASASSYCYKLSFPVFPEYKTSIREVAYCLLENFNLPKICPGYCLSCCSYLDLSSTIDGSSSLIDIDRFKSLIVSSVEKQSLISDILKSLHFLRSVRHPYSKIVAQVEDSVAEAFVMVGQLEAAKDHCQSSIEILERLYPKDHIVVAHEWIKLASIELSLGNRADASHNITRAEAVFSLYYGRHAAKIFAYVEEIKKEASRVEHGTRSE